MSVFVCSSCAGFADSDDGCAEKNGRLICEACEQEADDEGKDRDHIAGTP